MLKLVSNVATGCIVIWSYTVYMMDEASLSETSVREDSLEK